MSLSFSRKEEAKEGQGIPGLAGAEERHPADQRAHGGDPGGGRCRHGAVPWGRGCPEVHSHRHEHGESPIAVRDEGYVLDFSPGWGMETQHRPPGEGLPSDIPSVLGSVPWLTLACPSY